MSSLIKSTRRPRRNSNNTKNDGDDNNTGNKKMPMIEKAFEERITRLKEKLDSQRTIYERVIMEAERLQDGITETKRDLDRAMDELRMFNRMKFHADAS